MKKILYLILLLLFPLTCSAYSSNIIVGGNTLGIEINTKGIMVVGTYKINGKYLNEEIKTGDTIIKINDTEVNTINELVSAIEKNITTNSIPITIIRDDKKLNTILYLQEYKSNFRTGLYIKENVTGIGTLTYIDPETGIYGILGHPLNISSTNNKVDINNGVSYNASVTSFTRSSDGLPGAKNANIDYQETFGSIITNTNYGIFGKIDKLSDNYETMEISDITSIKPGLAYIYTTDLDNNVSKYEIRIIEINKETSEKNIFFEITDESLLEMSGGIVQGMSGSPIIQDDKIIGAVTRVLIDDVSRGYGISIITMLEEGDKISNQN